ncbi:MAG TPA: preprotein translocase subunit YajC [Streptomyces sp.]|nr:preprotein translocase subunit YajC [Streptomyces sp.]
MSLMTLLPFIVLIGAMFLMTRSAKKKQRAAAQMREEMQPGTGVRTIGGIYAMVKEVRDDAVLAEVADGTHVLFAKNAVGAVLEAEEFDRIVNGLPHGDLKSDDAPVVPDDASELTGDGEGRIDLEKSGPDASEEDSEDAAVASHDARTEDAKRDGDADAK